MSGNDPRGGTLPGECRAFGLSAQQQRLWRMQAGSSAYQSWLIMRMAGSVRFETLKQAILRAIDRHEALRTTFSCPPGADEALQIVGESAVQFIKEIDLRAAAAADGHSGPERLLLSEAAAEYDLTNGPLFRATIGVLGEGRSALLLSLPALLGDGHALRSLAREISHDYAACASGVALRSEPAEMLVQPSAFYEWQHEILEQTGGREGIGYWRQRFDTVEPALALPFERQVADRSGFRFDNVVLDLEPVFAREISEAVARYGVGLQAYLLAGWILLVGRLAARTRLTVGVAFDGRVSEELKEVVGLLARYLPVCGDLDPRLSFGELLCATQAALHGASQWQEYGLWPDASAASAQRERPEYFPIVFDFENAAREWHAANISFAIQREHSCFDRFAIRLRCSSAGGALKATIDYDADRFDRESIRQMAFSYVALLGRAMQDISSTILELSLPDAVQRHCLLTELNDTRAVISDIENVCEWIEAQVRQSPDHVALVCGDQQLTYAALDARAARIAAHLTQSGVTLETRVGVFIDQTLEAVVGLWAILKSGGTYVPIDPSYPGKRINYVLEDARVHVLLTRRALVARLPAGASVICIEDIDGSCPPALPMARRGLAAENAAYVIYTSGSTGQPKGAVVSHRNLVQSTFARFEYYRQPVTRFLMVSSLAFDSSCAGLFWALCGGGSLIFPEAGRENDPAYLCGLVAEQRATHMLCVPFLYRYFLSCACERDAHSLQTAIVAGDAFREELAAFHRQTLPNTSLHNEYGVTEASVWSTVSGDLGKAASGQRLSAGRPIANTRLYLLDRQLYPVSTGSEGELYLGGDGVCRGYLDRPGLTAEMFLPDPFGGEVGARMYRTRDMARYLPSGEVELLGRGDEQVKLRGYRIELKEIESVLARHPDVSDAVVLVQEGARRTAHLVAYVCPVAGTALLAEQIRGFLFDRLPPYMVPASVIVLLQLPLTPHGKVDRDALRRGDTGLPPEKAPSARPRNALEEKLVRIWSEVLGLSCVGVHDHFIECGGDSILSIQVVSRARREGLQLMPSQIFEHPTIAELASVVETVPMPFVKQGAITGSAPLTPIQHWFFEQTPANPNHFNQAIMLGMRRSVGLPLLQEALDALVVHHDALRLRFIRTSSGWQQDNEGPQLTVPLSSIDVSGHAGEACFEAIMASASKLQAGLELSQPPLVRGLAVTLNERGEQCLILISHHLQVDGVSWRILVEDLETCLDCLLQGRAIGLPPKTTSYKEWAERLCAFGRTGLDQREAAHWSSLAERRPARLRLDFPGGTNLEATSRAVAGSLSQDETTALFAHLRDVSINEALLTALVLAFSGWTATSSLFIDMEGHGREQLFDDIDVSRTVGWFSTIFPVQLDVAMSEAPSEQMRSIKRQLAEIPRRGIGHGILRYLCDGQAAATARAIPPAEVSFNYLGRLDPARPASALLYLARQTVGPTRDPDNERRHLIDVTAQVVAGELQFTFTSSSAQFRASTIQNLADSFANSLRSLFQSVPRETEMRPTPAEFPLIASTQEQLDRLFAKLDVNLQN